MSKGYDRELDEHPENDPSRPFVAPFAIGFVVLLLAFLAGVIWRVFFGA